MRDWHAYVRDRLPLSDLTPGQASRIVRELATQLEDFYRDGVARGLSDADADEHARAQISDWDTMGREVKQAGGRLGPRRPPRWVRQLDENAQAALVSGKGTGTMMPGFWQDFRHSCRQFAKHPGFTLVAVLTLAIGIGATTVMFSVLNGVVLRPLPYSNPDRLVRVFEIVPQYGRFSVAPANFFDWRQQNTAFDRIAAYSSGSATLSEGGSAERLVSAGVSWDLFDLLGVQPALGRAFSADEDMGLATVVVLSHGLWVRRFGGDPQVIGRPVTLNGRPATIVGVMGPAFYFPSRDADLWTPLGIDPAGASRGGHYLGVVARLKPGRSINEARAEMEALAGRLALEYPANNTGESAGLAALHEDLVRTVRQPLFMLLGAVTLVVLIACANVASLLLVRGSVAAREIAIRGALGAPASRLIRQMLTESLLLAGAGGVAGVGIAYVALGPTLALGTGSLPHIGAIAIDAPVLAFAFALSVLTALVFGAAPAWQATHGAVYDALKDGGRSATGAGGQRIRNGLVIGEVALSLILLIGAMLLMRSFTKVTAVDPGFDTAGVLTFRVSLPAGPNPGIERVQYYSNLLERLRQLPSVTAAGLVQQLPLQGQYVLSVDRIEGRPDPAPGNEPSANYRAVSPKYFEALGVPLDRGRLFTERDTADAPLVAIVNEAFVRRHFPGEDAIGHRIEIGNGSEGFAEIVGVVADVLEDGLDLSASPTTYVPFTQDPMGGMAVLVRSSSDPRALVPAVRDLMQQLDRGVPPFRIAPLDAIVGESVASRRFPTLLLGAFAAIASFLAAVGLYGVLSYTVEQRTQEIGVRLAIGAAPPEVWRLVLGHGLKLTVIGVVVGLAGALALSRLLTSLLFDVAPFDPLTYATTGVMLVAVAMLACFLPARRATQVDPIVALRAE